MTNKATDKPLTFDEAVEQAVKENGGLKIEYIPVWRAKKIFDQAAELYKDSALEAQKGEIERLQDFVLETSKKSQFKVDDANRAYKIAIIELAEKSKEIEALKQA